MNVVRKLAWIISHRIYRSGQALVLGGDATPHLFIRKRCLCGISTHDDPQTCSVFGGRKDVN